MNDNANLKAESKGNLKLNPTCFFALNDLADLLFLF